MLSFRQNGLAQWVDRCDGEKNWSPGTAFSTRAASVTTGLTTVHARLSAHRSEPAIDCERSVPSHCAVTLLRQHCIPHRHLQRYPARPYTASGRSVKPYIILPQHIRRCRQLRAVSQTGSQLELRGLSAIIIILGREHRASQPAVRPSVTQQHGKHVRLQPVQRLRWQPVRRRRPAGRRIW